MIEKAPVFEPHTPDTQLGDPAAGKNVFVAQNCIICHKVGTDEHGKIDLINAICTAHTPTALAVAMRNHHPVMFPVGETEWIDGKSFGDSQMNELIGYVFAEGYFGVPESSERGEALFQQNGCAQCHLGGEDDAPFLPHPRTASTPSWDSGPRSGSTDRSCAATCSNPPSKPIVGLSPNEHIVSTR